MAADVVVCENYGRENRVPAAAPGPRGGHCQAPVPWIAEAGCTTTAV